MKRLRKGGRDRRGHLGRAVRQCLVHALVAAGGLVIAIPFMWMITMSLKPVKLSFINPAQWIPTHFEWVNYANAWQVAPFLRYYANSLIVAASTSAGQIVLSAMAAYALSRLRFRGRDALFLALLGTMMVPTYVTLVPLFLIVRRFGWVDSYWGLAVPKLATAFGIFLLRQYFLTIPSELDDAARIDGCSRLGILWKVIMPLSKPAVSALAIFTFVYTWNDFLWPVVVTNSTGMRTVQVGLAMFAGRYTTRWPVLMAGTVISTVPGVIVYLAAQRSFIEGISLTGMKG